MALATTAEFQSRLGRTLTGADLTRAQAALDDASSIVLPLGLSTWTVDTVPDDVSAVVLRLARRMFDNPDGARQTSIGNFNVAYPSGHDWLTDAERRLIRRAAGKNTFRTVPLTNFSTLS